MRAALAIIGKGSSFGIHVRTIPIDIPQESADINGQNFLSSDVITTIESRWAILNGNISPDQPGRQLLKVSRHRDQKEHIWTWIGYYNYTSFFGEGRGGFYFGVGIAFCDAILTGQIGKTLGALLEQVIKIYCVDNDMRYSIFDREFIFPEFDIFNKIKIHPDSLRAGLSPSSTSASFVHHEKWSAEEIDNKINMFQCSDKYSNISGVFVGNWENPVSKSKIYIADNEPSRNGAARERLFDRTSTDIRESQPFQLKPVSQNEDNSSHNLKEVMQKLSSIDRRLNELTKLSTVIAATDRSSSSLVYFHYIVIFLVGIIAISLAFIASEPFVKRHFLAVLPENAQSTTLQHGDQP